jgi:hypothetical protein
VRRTEARRILAAIDAGSNSIKLLVARTGDGDHLDVLAREKVMVRLGHDALRPDVSEEALEARSRRSASRLARRGAGGSLRRHLRRQGGRERCRARAPRGSADRPRGDLGEGGGPAHHAGRAGQPRPIRFSSRHRRRLHGGDPRPGSTTSSSSLELGAVRPERREDRSR